MPAGIGYRPDELSRMAIERSQSLPEPRAGTGGDVQSLLEALRGGKVPPELLLLLIALLGGGGVGAPGALPPPPSPELGGGAVPPAPSSSSPIEAAFRGI